MTFYVKISIPLFIIFFSIFNNSVFAQEEMNWDQKFAFAGGFTTSLIIPDVEAINQKLNIFGTGGISTGGIIAYGGSGHVSIPFLKNFRIGGMGLGGESRKESIENGIRREAVYSASIGGFTAEYSLHFIKGFAVSVGAIVGAGTTSVELYSRKQDFDWDDIWIDAAANSTDNVHRKIYNSYFSVAPTLNIDIPLNRFLALRIGGGYQFAFDNKWHYDNTQQISSIPNNVNSNWLFFQTGIFLGYFSY